MKKIIGVFIVTVVFLLGASVLMKQNNYKKSHTIILGTMSGWPPYVSMNERGEYEGFDIDIAHEIAQRLGKTLFIQDMDTVGLISALQTDKVDFIMTGLDITHERLKQIAMIPYEGETVTSYPLIFWEKIPEHIHQLEDIQTIANAVVCVEPGSSQESFLGQYKNLFIIKEVSPFIALLEIKSGKALAILLQDNLFKEFKIKYPQLVALQIPIDEQHQILGNGIGIKKENQLLIQQITTIINDLKKDGKMVFLKHKWLK